MNTAGLGFNFKTRIKFKIKSTIQKINETNDLSSKYVLRRKFDELIEQYCFLSNKLNIEI